MGCQTSFSWRDVSLVPSPDLVLFNWQYGNGRGASFFMIQRGNRARRKTRVSFGRAAHPPNDTFPHIDTYHNSPVWEVDDPLPQLS